jgi:hypothetical protein
MVQKRFGAQALVYITIRIGKRALVINNRGTMVEGGVDGNVIKVQTDLAA